MTALNSTDSGSEDSRHKARAGSNFSAAARVVFRALGGKAQRRDATPEEQIAALLRQGAATGLIEEAEREMVRRVFRLGDQTAAGLMTPMADVVWLDVADPSEVMQQKIRESPHSRFPVCEGSIDVILGVVDVKALLIQSFGGKPFGIKGLLTLPLFIYEGTTGLKALALFKETGTHFAVILNEYGSVLGVLTLTDILEAIVGALPGEDDPGAPRAERRPDGSWVLDGLLPLDEFPEGLGITPPVGDYRTLAGFVISRLGHIPRVSESFDWSGLRFEVVGMDGHRVHRVAVSPL